MTIQLAAICLIMLSLEPVSGLDTFGQDTVVFKAVDPSTVEDEDPTAIGAIGQSIEAHALSSVPGTLSTSLKL